MIRGAPFSCAIIAILSGLVVWWALTEKYGDQISTLQQHRHFLQDHVTEYERKLGLLPRDGTIYSAFTNRELKQRTKRLIQDLRALIQESETNARNAFGDHVGSTMGRRPTKAEIEREWVPYERKETMLATQLEAKYEEQFRTSAIGCRDELLKRLSRSLEEDKRRLYDRPRGRSEIRTIANDLDALSAVLSD